MGQGAGQGHALLLATGKLTRQPFAKTGQPHQFQQFIATAAAFASANVAHTQPEFDIVSNGHVLKEGIVLKDEANIAGLAGQSRNIAAMQQDPATVNVGEAGNHAQRRRFATTAGSQQDKKFAVGNFQGEVVDNQLTAIAFG